MEPCGILDSTESKMLEQLVDKKVSEMERQRFCIVTDRDKQEIREQIKAELFLQTGKIII